TAAFGRAPVGAGCYRFVAWKAGQSLELAADSTCFLGRPHIRRLLWRFTPDPSVAVTQLVAGEADVYEIVPPQDFERVRADSQLVTYPYAGPYYTFLGFNLRARGDTSLPHPLFGDRQLRRALTLATDRQQLVQSVFGGLAKVPPGPMPLLWATWDSTLRVLPFDSAAAGRLLGARGWRDHDGDGVRDKDGQKLAFELLTPTTSVIRRQYARLLQEQFRRVGVAVEITEVDNNVMTQRLETGNFDAALMSRIADPSPTSSVALVWLAGGGSNYSHYDNPVFAEAYARATGATTRQASMYGWRAVFQQLIDDAPGTPFLPSTDARSVGPEIIARLRRQYGLDRPLPVQYLKYIGSVAHGEFGESFSQHRPVAQALADAVPNTVLLGIAALVIEF